LRERRHHVQFSIDNLRQIFIANSNRTFWLHRFK
jgi:hypothetical protein